MIVRSSAEVVLFASRNNSVIVVDCPESVILPCTLVLSQFQTLAKCVQVVVVLGEFSFVFGVLKSEVRPLAMTEINLPIPRSLGATHVAGKSRAPIACVYLVCPWTHSVYACVLNWQSCFHERCLLRHEETGLFYDSRSILTLEVSAVSREPVPARSWCFMLLANYVPRFWIHDVGQAGKSYTG